ncbi:MAG: family 16 glycoside hydrolase [Verrucomicrobiota bacterium]
MFKGWNLKDWTFEKGAWSIDKPSKSMTCHMKEVTDSKGNKKQVGMGYIWSKQAYENFELRLQYKLSEGANSGVFYRTDPNDPVQGGF